MRAVAATIRGTVRVYATSIIVPRVACTLNVGAFGRTASWSPLYCSTMSGWSSTAIRQVLATMTTEAELAGLSLVNNLWLQ